MSGTNPNSSNNVGEQVYSLIKKLFPICRSITGNGVRETLHIIREIIPIHIHEVTTGTKVFDWEVPKEWNIEEAWIKDPEGNKVIDFKEHNLHVLNYSVPVSKELTLEELKEHLYTLPDQPDLIPYRTSYYQKKWGFCLTHNQLKQLKKGTYRVHINSTLKDGSLTYGELLIKGKSKNEVLISCHNCHPSLCNDNLSGVSTAVYLAKSLMKKSVEYSYRFLFIPGTIGSITWLALNEEMLDNIRYGLVLSCMGDSGNFTYKKSRQGDSGIDRVVKKVLTDKGQEFGIRDFMPYGYDERQYCSPAFNLPVGCLMRSHYGEFPEYHTSADNLDFVKSGYLEESFQTLEEIISIIEGSKYYLNLNPKGEPNLGRRGLYSLTGGEQRSKEEQVARLWVLNLSDGSHTLLDIAEQSGMPFSVIRKAADVLLNVNILKEVNKH